MVGLIADIGGTNARFALVSTDGQTIYGERVLACAQYDGLVSAARTYLADIGPDQAPSQAAIALACPILGDQVCLTNLPSWNFSVRAVVESLGLDRLQVVNDFEAVALAVPHLRPQDHFILNTGTPDPTAPIAVLGPGTGLGVAALLPGGAGGRPVALATEGGHATLAADTDTEAEILARIRRRHGHVSAERLLSGSGLVLIYDILAEMSGVQSDIVTPALIGLRLVQKDPLAEATFEVFTGLLGGHAGNVALTFGARGGVVLAGGLLPRWLERLAASPLLQRFCDKGRFTNYLEAIPLSVATHPYPAFLGLAGLLREDTGG